MQKLILTLLLFSGFMLCSYTTSLGQTNPKSGAFPERSIGDPTASVVVEVFNDYQCPPCAKLNEILNSLQVKYAGKVRFVFRNFPLNSHRHARLAAQAAEAGGLQGKFLEMIELIYTKQGEWASSNNAKRQFLSYAKQLGLNVQTFRNDLDGSFVQQRIDLDVERVRFLEVKGTPTVFLNQVEVPFERLQNLEEEIEMKLKGSGPN